MENRDVKYDDREAGVCARRYLVGLGADDRGGVQVRNLPAHSEPVSLVMVCSANGCMRDYNPVLSELVSVAGLEGWIYRCDDHARKHYWTRLGGSKYWHCWVCRTETKRDGDGSPPEGPCVKEVKS